MNFIETTPRVMSSMSKKKPKKFSAYTTKPRRKSPQLSDSWGLRDQFMEPEKIQEDIKKAKQTMQILDDENKMGCDKFRNKENNFGRQMQT